MADDADRVVDLESRIRRKGRRDDEPPADPVTVFVCFPKKESPRYETRLIMATFAPRWVDLGWSEGAKLHGGKMEVEWRREGAPVFPRKP